MVFFVGQHVLKGPFQSCYKCRFTHRAIVYHTNWAGGRKTRVGMNEKFNFISKLFFNEVLNTCYFLMAFFKVIVPGQCNVCIHVQMCTIFQYTEVVHVDPFFSSAIIEDSD